MYRGTRGGQVTFYELMTVVEAGGSLRSGSSTSRPTSAAGSPPSGPWTSRWSARARSALYFDGLTYRRTTEGIESWVLIGLGDGGTRPERFLYAPRAP